MPMKFHILQAEKVLDWRTKNTRSSGHIAQTLLIADGYAWLHLSGSACTTKNKQAR